MKSPSKSLILVIVLTVAFIGFAVIHPYRYGRLEKEHKCSCHSLDPQTTPPQELVFDPPITASIIMVVVAIFVGTAVYWPRKAGQKQTCNPQQY